MFNSVRTVAYNEASTAGGLHRVRQGPYPRSLDWWPAGSLDLRGPNGLILAQMRSNGCGSILMGGVPVAHGLRWVLLLFALAASGCGGTGRGSLCGGGACGPPVAQLAVQPSSIAFPNQQGKQSVTVSVTGGVSPYTATASDARYIDVSMLSYASGPSFTVTPVAGGNTSITVRDGIGHFTSVPVTIDICVPPAPALWLVYPSPKATGVPASITAVWGAILTTDPGLPNVGMAASRLIANDGSVVHGGNFAITSATPPPGSTIPPSNSGGYTYTYDYATSAVSGLKSGVTYKVQMTVSGYSCLPPVMMGQFST